MSDPRELLRTYLRQRAEAGETPVTFNESREPLAGSRTPEAETPAPGSRLSTFPVPGSVPKWMKGAPEIPPPGLSIAAPPKDLFTSDPLLTLDIGGLAARVAECRKCGLCEGRTKTVPGEGPADARLVVVGEGPGKTEDETGRPFVGRAGELLTEILAAIGLPREQVFICNVVKCRPPDNRKPLPDEIAACVPYLHRQIDVIRPAVLLAMGATAAETLLSTRQSLSSLRERVHDFRGIPLIVTYHPAALLRNPHWKKPTWDDVRIARRILDAR